MPWTPPGPVDSMTLARLPFPTAQRLLAGAVIRGSAVRTACDWYADGPDGDSELGSFCMVRADGPLTTLVGERVRIRVPGASVYAYCHKSAPMDEDVSLHRSLFARLGRLDVTALSVVVEVLS